MKYHYPLLFLSFAASALAANGAESSSSEQPVDALADTAAFSADAEAEPMDPLYVDALRRYYDHLPLNVKVVHQPQIEESRSTNVLTSVMEHTAGVTISQRGVMGYGVSTGAAGGIMVRGISSANGGVKVFVDGHPSASGVFGHPLSDSYQSLGVESVQMLKGPSETEPMGGTILISTRPRGVDGVSTEVKAAGGSYGTFQSESFTLFKKEKFRGSVGLDYNRTDGHRERMWYNQYGGKVKLAYAINSIFDLSLHADVSHFNAENPGPTTAPLFDAVQHITRGGASLVLNNYFGVSSYGFANVYYNGGDHKINDGHLATAEPQKDLFRSRDALIGAYIGQIWNVNPGWQFSAGLHFEHIYGHAFYTFIGTDEVNTAGRRAKQSGENRDNTVSAYGRVQKSALNGRLVINAGLGFNSHSQCKSELTPNYGVAYTLPNYCGTIKYMGGKGFRMPNMKELYLYGSANDSLRAEKLFSHELTWVGNTKRVRYAVTGYYIKAENMIQTIQQHNINTGELRNSGVELEADACIVGDLFASTNHSYLHMKNVVIGAADYKGVISLSYRPKRWMVEASLICLSGLHTSETNKEHATLLSLNAHFDATKWLTLYAKGDNLLAQRYCYNEGYPMPRATAIGGLKFTF